jgi:hypothetical protein
MAANDPRLPGAGITFRVLRDDGMTYAGVTVDTENYNLTSARAKLAAATGLTAGEIARANAVTFPGVRSPREPVKFGPGWGIYIFPTTITAYIARDDGTNLSYGAPEHLFTPARSAAVLGATSGLTANETARIAAMGNS